MEEQLVQEEALQVFVNLIEENKKLKEQVTHQQQIIEKQQIREQGYIAELQRIKNSLSGIVVNVNAYNLPENKITLKDQEINTLKNYIKEIKQEELCNMDMLEKYVQKDNLEVSTIVTLCEYALKEKQDARNL